MQQTCVSFYFHLRTIRIRIRLNSANPVFIWVILFETEGKEAMWTSASKCRLHLKGSVKEPNKFHNYESEKITRKASDTAEYIELFSSSTWDRHARRI